jgi:AcrR family transcriptional regulator
MKEPRTSKSWQAGPLRIQVEVAPPAGVGGPRAGERERPRERLSVDRIVDTALKLMRAEGYEAVSMRSVAKALDTGPASLYAHVANKDELDQRVIDRIAQQVDIPVADPERWDEQIKDMMRQALTLYREHPGSARAIMGLVPTGYGSMRSAEGLLSFCRAGGVPDQVAAWFCDLISLYTGAVAVEETIWVQRAQAAGLKGEQADFEAMDEQIASYMESLPVDQFPLMSSLARVMTNGDGEQRFEFGLSVLVAGLKAVSAEAPTS